MTVRIFPCFGCSLGKGCDKRSGLSKRVSGLGLRAAAFPCDRLGAEIRIGRRIVIMQPVAMEDPNSWEEHVTIVKREVAATITGTSDHYRFACTVDKGAVGEVEFSADAEDRKRFRKTQAHHRIVRFLDEPDAEVCINNNVKRDGGCDRLGECACEEARREAIVLAAEYPAFMKPAVDTLEW